MSKPILHLVLYSPSAIYDKMREITREFYKQWNDKVQTVYYYYDEDVKEDTLVDDFLKIKGKETFIPGILMKTIKAMEYFDSEKYSYLVRSNISTLVNFDNLIPHLSPNIHYAGNQISCIQKLLPSYGIYNDSIFWIPMVHGGCLIFTPHLWKWILDNTNKIDFSLMDDISLSVMIRRHRPDIYPKRFEPPEIMLFDKNTNLNIAICYRNRVNMDRTLDINNMMNVVQALDSRKQIKSKVIKNIKYGCNDKYIDITQKIFFMCLSGNSIINTSENVTLDRQFGDPCPGIVKRLCITFEDNSLYDQAAVFNFSFQNNKLVVS